MSSSLSSSVTLNRLKQLIPFTDADLAANRSGRLGQTQGSLIFKRLRPILIMGGVFGVIVFVLSISSIQSASTRSTDPDLDPLPVPVLICANLGPLLLLTPLLGWPLYRYGSEIRAKEVRSVSGMLEVPPSAIAKRMGTNMFSLGGMMWTVEQSIMLALKPGQHYRLYYTPRTLTLVAIEPLESPTSAG